jgi:Ca-activated chloride channel family protein
VKKLLIVFCSVVLFAGASFAKEDAFALYRAGEYEAAAEAFAQKDMENPREPRWRYNRGVAQMRAGHTEEALAAFSSVSARAKDKNLSYASAFNAGNAAFEEQQYSLAADYFGKALAAKPDDSDAKANLALALWHQRQQEQSREDDSSKDQQACADEQQDGQQDKDGEKAEGGQQGQQQARDSSGQDEEGQKDAMTGPEDGQKDGKGLEDPAEKGGNQQDEDLTGSLAAMEQPQESASSRSSDERPVEKMEQNMASALLDNVTEDPGLMFWRMRQVSPHAAPSGKTW